LRIPCGLVRFFLASSGWSSQESSSQRGRLAESEYNVYQQTNAGVIGPFAPGVPSETMTHKTDIGGVTLNPQNAEAVRKAFQADQPSAIEKAGQQAFLGVTVQPMVRLDGYELIFGSSADAQFGPVILFGSGRQFVEVYRDHALADRCCFTIRECDRPGLLVAAFILQDGSVRYPMRMGGKKSVHEADFANHEKSESHTDEP